MTDTITISFWLRVALIVALDVCAIALIAFAAQRLTNSGLQRRAIWRAAQVALLLMLCFEFTGTSRGMASWLVGKSKPERKFSVRISFPQQQTVAPLPDKEVLTPPPIQEPASATIPKPVFWPGLLWLAGFALLLLRSVFARSLLLICARGRTEITDGVVRECVDAFAKRLGLRKKIRVIELKGVVSPVAHGIIRPTIGLPADFRSKFSREQQEAMLAHEVAHLAARDSFWYLLGDVSVALLWWHPLVWWIRLQLHSASEWAADESSVLIENGPTTLAECLVTLAGQMTPSRSFGWMGVEGNNFRSNLGKRVERLLKLRRHNWPQAQSRAIVLKFAATILLIALVAFTSGWIQSKGTPREKTFDGTLRQSWNQSLASITLAAFDTVGRSEERAVRQLAANQTSQLNFATGFIEAKVESAPDKAARTNDTSVVSDKPFKTEDLDRHLAERERLSEEVMKMEATPTYSPTNSKVQQIFRQMQALDDQIAQDKLHRFSEWIAAGKGRQAIISKLDKIHLKRLNYLSANLKDVVREIATETKKNDPDQAGIGFFISFETDSPPSVNMSAVRVTIDPPLLDVRLADVLDAIVKCADQPIKYSIQDYAIVFSAKIPATSRASTAQTKNATNSSQLVTRIFKVDPNAFFKGLESAGAIQPNTTNAASMQAAVKAFFKSAGVELIEPKAVYFNQRGMLYVRATARDLDAIEQAIQVLNYEPPQINIKARFVEIDEAKAKKRGLDWLLGNIGVPLVTNSVSSQLSSNGIESLLPVSRATGVQLKNSVGVTMTGILTDPQYRKVLQLLEKTDGADVLTTPEVTTVSGRQAQIQVVDIRTIVTGVSTVTGKDGASTNQFKTESLPFGPVLDVIPYVSADGYTIQMTIIPTVTEFMGYDDPGLFVPGDFINGQPIRAQLPLPHFRLRQITTSANVWDGQTIVLGGLVTEDTVRVKNKVPILGDIKGAGALFRNETKTTRKKNLLIFVTPTIIDPAGNRTHSEEEMPFSRIVVPPR